MNTGIAAASSEKSSILGQVPAWLWVGIGVYMLLLSNGGGLSERFRHLLADRGGPVDPRSPRNAARRHLFLHQGGRAVDIVVLAVAGAVCGELQSGGLDRAGGSRRDLHRCDLRVSRSYSRPPCPAAYAVAIAMAALVLSMGHFLARPHVLVLPVMLAWATGC